MICTKCSNQVPDGSVFCNHCGKKLIKEKKNGGRANGTGSVYYDSRAKRWVAQFVVGRHYTEDKKLRFEYKRQYFKSKTDALKAVQKLEEKANARPDYTVAYYYNSMSSYIEGLHEDKQYAYRKAYERLKPIYNVPVKDLTLPQLQEIVDTTTTTYHPAHNIRTVLNGIFKKAVADDKEINPYLPSMITLPKMEEADVQPFSEEEQLKMWYSYEEGNTDLAAPLIMIYTGMMPGEVLKLTKDMIDLEAKEIVKDVGLKTKERKKRSVLLPDDIIPVVEDAMARAKTDRLFPMTRKQLYKIYYPALERAGITRHLTPYSCRHTTATAVALRGNVAPQVLQRIMRWKDTRMADRYVTPDQSDARKALKVI